MITSSPELRGTMGIKKALVSTAKALVIAAILTTLGGLLLRI